MRQDAIRICSAVALASAAQGCMFLVDFDELKQGREAPDGGLENPSEPEPSPGGGGSGGGSTSPFGGSSGQGGTGPGSGGDGSGPTQTCATDEECADPDPCTADSCSNGVCENTALVCESSDPCLDAMCVDGQCVEQPKTGVFLDGFEDVLTGDELYRTTLVASSDRFFHAVYGIFDGVEDLRLGGFDATGSGRIRAQSLASGLMGANFEIGSPGSLVIDDTGSVNVYVGARNIALGSATELGEVLRIVFDRDLGLTSQTARKQGSAASYRFGSNRVGPEASMVPGGEPFVVWTGQLDGATPTDGLFFQVGDEVVQVDDPGAAFIPVANPVAALRAVHTDTLPAAVWLTDVPGGGIEVFAGTAAGENSQLSQCQDDPGYTSYNLHAGLTLDDLWTVSWSKQGAMFTSENTVVQCAGSTCEDRSGVSVGEQCSTEVLEARVSEDFRHLLVEAFEDPEDPNFLYQIIVLAAQDASTTSMAMVVNNVDIGPDDSGATRIDNVTFATGSGANAPDYPEVAVLPPDKIVVSWTQRSEDGTRDEAHFARYHICD
jgi:hypothetical protein